MEKNLRRDGIRRLRDACNFVLSREDCEKSGGDSVTIQTNVLSVREIYERYVNGMDPEGMKDAVYPDEDMTFDMPDLEKINQLDLFDKQELAREFQERLDARFMMAKDAKDARDKAQAEAAALAKAIEPDAEEYEKPRKGVSGKFTRSEKPRKSSSSSNDFVTDED